MRTIKKIALLVDVDNVKIGGEAFNELYAKLNEIGDVVYCKFYGYNDRKHIYLSDAIAKFGYETAPFMRYKKRYSQLDARMIVDALKLNYTKTEIDTYCIVAGDGDLIPLLVELKTSGRMLIDINTPYQEQNYHMFDAHLNIENLALEAETYKPRSRKRTTTKTAKPKPEAKPEVKQEVKQEEKPAENKVEAPSYTQTEEVATYSLSEVQEVSSYTPPLVEKETTNTPPATAPVAEEVSSYTLPVAEEKPVYTPPAVEEKPAYTPPVVEEEPAYTPPTVEEEPVEDEQEETQAVDDKLGEVLRDITNRYAELDFETNDDMDKKLQLIKDIELFIRTETSKGEGLNSSNEEVRQIFAELSEIVEDMKNAI